jgi:NADH dehydrogenase FAD-containing subunit
VTKVDEKDLIIKAKDGTLSNVPYGTLVWVTGRRWCGGWV